MENYTIFTVPSANNEIYELLTDPLKGENTCLSGTCECTDKFNQIDGILEFCLSDEQRTYLEENYNVETFVEYASAALDDFTITDVASGQFIPRMAGYQMEKRKTSSGVVTDRNIISHHLYHTQHISVDKSIDAYTNIQKLSSIDCSNVDIVVLDTGIDITHPDVGDNVVQFDWALLGDGSDGTLDTGSRIIEGIDSSYQGSPLTQVPANYYKDRSGHGTACASLIAGKRSGLAKSANLYALRFLDNPVGFNDTTGQSAWFEGFQSPTIVMKLALAFLRAKNNNKLGLDSNRPTIFSNSWGYNSKDGNDLSSTTLMDRIPSLTNNIQRYNGSGDKTYVYREYKTVEGSFFTNRVVEQIVSEGGHWVAAAGNSNTILDARNVQLHSSVSQQKHYRFALGGNLADGMYNVPTTKELLENQTFVDSLTTGSFDLHRNSFEFADIEDGFYGPGFTVRQINGSIRTHYPNFSYGTGPNLPMRRIHTQKYLSGGPSDTVDFTHNGITKSFAHTPSTLYDNLYTMDDNDLTTIIVGDISPVYNPFDRSVFQGFSQMNDDYLPYYGSGNNSSLVHSFLSGKNIDSENNFLFDSNRCDALSSVPYVKTQYSNFGKDVDIYAPGNGTLAAVSNFASPYGPAITVGTGEQYGFFNGTSAACPVVAGCLATYLAEHPTATPKQAKQYLIDSSIKGNILETSFEEFNDNDEPFDHLYHTACVYHKRRDSIPMVEKTSNPHSLSALVWSTSTFLYRTELSLEKQSESIQKVAMLHNHRFFDSHNRVVQAYPLRKAVVQQETSSPSNAIKIGEVNDIMSLSGSVLPEVNTFITHLSSSITQEL
jgi:subtilisin family serine protease